MTRCAGLIVLLLFAALGAEAKTTEARPRWFPFFDLAAPSSPSPVAAARELLLRHADDLGISRALVMKLTVDAVHDTGRGAIIVIFNHREGELEVWRDAVRVSLQRGSLRLLAVSAQIHEARPVDLRFSVRAQDAVAAAFADVSGAKLNTATITVNAVVDGSGYQRVTAPDGTFSHARLKPVLAPIDGVTVPAWVVEVAAQTQNQTRLAASVVVDARSGRVLSRSDLVRDAAFSYRVFADDSGDHRPFDSALQDNIPYPVGAADGYYPQPIAPNLVTIDGFNVNADPWLDADATQSSGNNVDAFTDDANPVGFSAGDLRAALTAPLTFDHTEDTTIGPQANDDQRMAAAVQLFYVVNWLHDWWYDSGFDESAHNARNGEAGEQL